MNTEELKKEIEMNSYTENPNSLTRVIDVDTVLELIDELANNNESIDLVSKRGKVDTSFDALVVKRVKCDKGYVFEKCDRWKNHINGCNFCKKENVC